MCKIREYVHIHINICNYKPYDIIHTYAHGECICHAARSSRDAIAMERPRRSTANGEWTLHPRTCIMLEAQIEGPFGASSKAPASLDKARLARLLRKRFFLIARTSWSEATK